MKNIIRLSLCILIIQGFITFAYGKCAFLDKPYVWPSENSKIHQSQIFLFNYRFSSLGSGHKFFLVSKEQRIPLYVISPKGSSDLVLKPRSILNDKRVYDLQILDGDRKVATLGNWTVNKEIKNTPIEWLEKPRQMPIVNYKSSKEFYSTLLVLFEYKLKYSNKHIVKITLSSLNKKHKRLFYQGSNFDSDSNSYSIVFGRSFCGGGFELSEDEYEVSFALVDSKDGKIKIESDTIKFSKPTETYTKVN